MPRVCFVARSVPPRAHLLVIGGRHSRQLPVLHRVWTTFSIDQWRCRQTTLTYILSEFRLPSLVCPL